MDKASREGRTTASTDESGVSEQLHRWYAWGPVERTPVLQYHFYWDILLAMDAVTCWHFNIQFLLQNL